MKSISKVLVLLVVAVFMLHIPSYAGVTSKGDLDVKSLIMKDYLENPPNLEAAMDIEVVQNPQDPNVISVIIKASSNFEVANISIPISYPEYITPFAEIVLYEPFDQWDGVFPCVRHEKLEEGQEITYLTIIGWSDLGGAANPYFQAEELQPICKVDFNFDQVKAELALENEHMIKPVVDFLMGRGIFGDKHGIHGVEIEIPERSIAEATSIALGKIIGDEASLPTVFSIDQNYPNPFNARTKINYAIPENCHVRIETFDILGRKVATLVDKQLPVGYHTIVWNASDIPSGLYFYKISAGNFEQTKKLALIK